jgi:TonB family protein
MKALAGIFAGLLLGPLPVQAVQPLHVQIEWTLTLDADGSIVDLAPAHADFLPAVRKQIEPTVRQWHFTPGKVGGQPARTVTTLSVGVALDPTNGDEYKGHVTSAATGATYRHVAKPEYPQAAQHLHHEGAVMLSVDYDAEGRVTTVRNVPKMGTPHVDRSLLDAAIEAVKSWTFRPETVAGHGVAGSALAPICFQMSDASCRWNRQKSGQPIHPGKPVALASVVGLDMGSASRTP